MMPSLIKFIKDNLKTMFWLSIAGIIMSWFYWNMCCTTVSSLVWISIFTVTLWISLWLGNSYLGESLSYFYSWHTDPVKRLALGLAGMTLYTVGVVYGIVSFFRHVFNFDVGDNLSTTYTSTIIITLIITMFMTGREFLVNWRQAAVDAEASKRESIMAQYESLKNQVNPHFLFNSLNALTNLVYVDQDKAVRFIKQLSEVYRYVLETRDKEVVPLTDEVKFMESYLFLQQIRFGDKLKIEMKMQGIKGMVAPLALQMLVENAIKHNVIAEDHPLTVKIYEQQGQIIVENSLLKKTTLDEGSAGVGLENIRKRYGFLSESKVQVSTGPEKFLVSIPIIQPS